MSYAHFPNDGAALGPARSFSRNATPAGFIAVPAPLASAVASGAKSIYEMAYEQARAALRPSRYDHLMACFGN